jgi:oxygen-independent coproporphyrinogen III oxidase
MPLSVYLHIPFCTHRCGYCDFNTYAGHGALIPAYVEALCREVRMVGEMSPAGTSVHTIFLGGGTPSLLSAQDVESILAAIRDVFFVEQGAEVTLEANPGTVTLQSLRDFRRAGVNRVSLGVQSANGEELRLLERTHDFGDVRRAVSDVRVAGFENLNLDVIYGLPEQTVPTWDTTLRRIVDLQPEHIAAYCLTLEHGTPFGMWTRRGLMPLADPDLAADMYEVADQVLAAAGYEQYEISNWSLPGRECRHNLQYWKGDAYLGFGAGAHGYAAGMRYSNVLAIRQYIFRLGDTSVRPAVPREASRTTAVEAMDTSTQYPCSPAALDRHFQSLEDDMAEFMIMGLRLVRDGVANCDFNSRFRRDLSACYQAELQRLEALGLLEWIGKTAPKSVAAGLKSSNDPSGSIRLTRRGRLLGNQVFMSFLG